MPVTATDSPAGPDERRGSRKRESGRGVLDRGVRRARARGRDRHDDVHEQLLRPELGRERPGDELGQRNGSGARLRLQLERRAEREQDGRHVRRRVGVDDASSDRAAVSHLQVADVAGALSDRGQRRSSQRIGGDQRVPGRQRAHVENLAADLDAAEVESRDVDHERRPRDAELHHRDQRLAARDRLGVGLGEQGQRTVDVRGSLVPDRGRDHDAPPSRSAAPAALTDSTMV